MKIVSVKFKNGGKTYYFAPGKETYEKGMGVIVETAKGLEYATVVLPEGEVDESEVVSPLKPVVRIATKRDEEQVKRNAERRGEALKTAQEKIAARGLEMKLVDCEFAFDGSKVVFFFTAENRVDFRELIKDLSSAFRMRIELRQINIRDEIKITGGLAPCGRECCCIGCMPEPKKVSVKMAKNQGLSLNPGKISGLCGRLMCCLAYENEYYAEACKKVPKIGSEAETPDGKGTVVNVNMLKMLVKVKIEQNENVSYHEYPVDEIRFMRGNVVMGRESFDEDDDSDVLPEEDEKQPVAINTDKQRDRQQQGRGDRQNDRRGGGNNDRRDNRDNRNERRDNNRDRNKN
ncbi:MAG: stage 0 sporulation family protein, partial [Clostridia bacterium]|nr:stage 0 sporulation family protein [Clostridia bacterium]